MKCPSCSTVLKIRTDPKNTDYEYVEGIRKKDMAFDPEEAQTERVQDSEVSNKLAGARHSSVIPREVQPVARSVFLPMRRLH